LKFSLDSLLLQDLDKSRFEAIVADDGSSDDTAKLVETYKDKMNIKYVFQEDKGYRPGSARNLGILASEGMICLFIDSSVILHTTCLNEHLAFYTEKGFDTSALGFVYGFDHNEESEEILLGLVVPSDPNGSIERLAQYPVYVDVRDPHYIKYGDKLEDLPAPWYYFWTCHVSVPRNQLLKVGLFDDRYDGRWGAEDNDLGYRLHLEGVKIILLRAAKSIHYPHGKDKAARQKEGYENTAIFHDKFKTLATRIFFDMCMNPDMTDLNELLRMQPTEKLNVLYA
jgi:glycosyltransferase involved in cell wall biosynthesis